MPAVSKAQFRAMAAAAHGDSDAIDIDPAKAREYLSKVKYRELPEHKRQSKTKSK